LRLWSWEHHSSIQQEVTQAVLEYMQRLEEQEVQITEQEKRIRAQEEQIRAQEETIREHEVRIDALKNVEVLHWNHGVLETAH
jgi:hypothetical protein